MRSFRISIPSAAVMLLVSTVAVRAELSTEQEALTIARNYVSLVLVNEGDWGGSEVAEVVSIEEFRRGDRTLGYFCPVQPQGFLVLSLHKELAPVKAYSVWSNLDSEADQGLTDLLKDKMQAILNAVENKLGRPLKPDDNFGDLLEINYRPVYDVLAAEEFDPQQYAEPRRGRDGAGMNYQEGEELLTSNWHQQPPYNDDCPDEDCDEWAPYGHFNTNTRVGCVATAGAQVMRHWRWPPVGEPPYENNPFDWPNMCDEYVYDGAGWFNDENGAPVTQAQIDAVAGLSYLVGHAVDMDWGCDGSSATTSDMEDVYEDYFRYDSDGAVLYRFLYGPVEWFDMMKQQFNVNRTIQYRVEGHSIVADGWKEEWVGDDYYWYHMDYGWPNDSYDTWYALDALYLGGPGVEYMVTNIVPDVALGGPLSGGYGGAPGVWRYFDQDAWGANAMFAAGQWLQILRSGFFLSNSGGAGDSLTFYGAPDLHIRFFLYGDPGGKSRILIQGGAMQIHGGGGLAVY